MKNLPIALLVVAAIFTTTTTQSFAQTTRPALVQRIAEAQGLLEIFEQQLTQQRESMKGHASKIFEQSVAQSGGKATAKDIAAFERFVAKSAAVFTAREITSAWTSAYGSDLSVAELQEVLNYYESTIGRKDVAANKAAMVTFMTWMTQEAQTRATSLLKEYVEDLQAARQ